MALAMFGFSANDAIIKSLTGAFSVGQIMLVRGIFATLLIALLAWHQGALRRPALVLNPLVAARAVCELGATMLFLFALANMPFSNVSAILQSLPLAVTAGAALFFQETVRWRRWIAIAIGFTGVMVIVRPGAEGFNTYSIAVLVSVCFAAARDLITRQLPHEIPSLLVSTTTALGVTLAGAVLLVPLGGWSPMKAADIGFLAVAAVLLLVGYQFIIVAMRSGEIAFVAPFRYTSLLWAVMFGFFLFDERLNTPMIVGSALIIGSGLYSLYRERKVGQAKPISESTGEGMAPDGL
ncbi:MAG: DMT family transporter [Brucellaceae bacterium]|nr:DMT family transporter [Brucellaceae bacterium]